MRRAPDLRGLLREYAAATEGNPDGRVTREYLDVDLQPPRGRAAGARPVQLVILMCGDKRRALAIDDLYRFENRERSGSRASA